MLQIQINVMLLLKRTKKEVYFYSRHFIRSFKPKNKGRKRLEFTVGACHHSWWEEGLNEVSRVLPARSSWQQFRHCSAPHFQPITGWWPLAAQHGPEFPNWRIFSECVWEIIHSLPLDPFQKSQWKRTKRSAQQPGVRCAGWMGNVALVPINT